MNNITGVFFVGARGHIATVVFCGALALNKGLCSETGMVTAAQDFNGLNLVPVSELIFGGWDIREASVLENAKDLYKISRILDWETLTEIQGDLAELEKNIYPGTYVNCGAAIKKLSNSESALSEQSLETVLDKLIRDIDDFKKRNALESVIVVNLASTEPPVDLESCAYSNADLLKIISGDKRDKVRPSTLYAYAAIISGCPYINFTPSNAALLPGLIELALEKNVPVMGNDGKTGETLVKSALAPMFKFRNLKVLSWEGRNILGNLDGLVLNNPENKISKVKSKDCVLKQILGYEHHSRTCIDYTPSLDDWKTAWDFVHFEGFLNTRMSLQFTWQGCDSALAAPLVLDLIRLSEFALRNNEKGLMPHLASFFKSPVGVNEAALHSQYQLLENYIEKHKQA